MDGIGYDGAGGGDEDEVWEFTGRCILDHPLLRYLEERTESEVGLGIYI